MLADYSGGGLVNVMQSIRVGYRVEDDDLSPCTRLDPDEVHGARNVVFVIIDGLGYNYYQRHGSLLSRYLRGSVTSVFPSSTAPAITSVLTGRTPARHAVVGWNMHLSEIGAVVTFLPFRPRHSQTALASAGLSIESFVGAAPLADTLPLGTVHVLPKHLHRSAYSGAMAGSAERVPAGSLEQWRKRTLEVIRTAPGPRFVYAYWPELDARCHAQGTESAAARRHLRQIERAVLRLIDGLSGSDTLLIVSADHGFIDVDDGSVHRLEDHPRLSECLSTPLCGEARVAYCHVRPGRSKAFSDYVGEHLAHAFELHSSAELIDEGWFGPDRPDARLGARTGDWVLIGRGHNVIKDALPNEPPWKNIGVHGGVSEDEMLVPLFVAQC